MPTPQEFLASSGQGEAGIKFKELVGQSITITDFKTSVSAKYPGRVFANFGYVDSDGEEGRAYTSAVAVVSKLEALREALPIEVQVVTYPTDKGNPGFDITNPDA